MQQADPIFIWDVNEPGARALVFRSAQHIITCFKSDRVADCLRNLDELRAGGHTLAGYFSYEAFDMLHGLKHAHAAPPLHPSSRSLSLPLIWQAVFEEVRTVDAGELDDILAKIEQSYGARQYSLIRAGSAGEWQSPAARLKDSLQLYQESRQESGKFARAFRQIQRHFIKGDCYQVNYTRQSLYNFSGNPVSLYRRLRRLQPTMRSALILHKDRAVLSLSPELFFQLQAELVQSGTGLTTAYKIQVEPMKGTAPRSGDKRADQAMAQSLRKDPKTRAENIMIVDLLRNDLGKIARAGSVVVDELFQTIRLPGLYQLVSRISAYLQPDPDDPERYGYDFFTRLWPALFPSGSVTGAPRRRVRCLIQELEDGSRGIYTGAIGYTLPEGQGKLACFNVAIRTLDIDLKKNQASYGAGCGIVRDSGLIAEWNEYKLKQSFLAAARDDFHLIETILLQDGQFFLLALHLERLQRSAEQLFLYNPADLSAILHDCESELNRFAGRQTVGDYRVRLALYRNGFAVETNKLERFAFGWSGSKYNAVNICLARARIYSGDPLRRHKSSERTLYNLGWQAARTGGFRDIIFFNERREVVECATANLLVLDSEGQWSYPAPDSGALAGVMLRNLLQNNRRLRPRCLKLHDLKNARAIFVLNSVLGLRRACIDWKTIISIE